MAIAETGLKLPKDVVARGIEGRTEPGDYPVISCAFSELVQKQPKETTQEPENTFSTQLQQSSPLPEA